MSPEPALVLATANEHKVEEIRAILLPLIPDLEPERIVSMAQFDVTSPVEDALTFEENALIKSRAVAKATGFPTLADDSGLTVDALRGMPGVFSARWSGHHGDDGANLQLLLAQLADLKPEQRKAAFVCAATLSLPDGRDAHAEGVLRGSLTYEPRGTNGFGYDPIFLPENSERTTAQMSSEEKNAISHRARAFTALAPKIRDLLF